MKEVIEAALKAVVRSEPAALVTPVAATGSLPTPREARMLVRPDNTIVGTVGGGRMEAEARQAALSAIREGEPRLIEFSLTAEAALDDGLLCGGQTTFFVEPILSGTSPEALEEMQRLLENRVPGLEAVQLREAEPVQRLAAGADGGRRGTLGSAALDQAVAGQVEEVVEEDWSGVREIEAGGERVEVFVRALLARPTVYIFGGGHVGLAVAQVAPLAGFRVVVADDRSEFASRQRFPMADEVRVAGFENAVEDLPIDEFSYLVVMTRGHKWDREVVTQALRTRAGYIGMIGSRRKIALTWEALKQEGFTDEDLGRVHAPIGLDIGGDTPGEIAVSIVAELIQVRRRGK